MLREIPAKKFDYVNSNYIQLKHFRIIQYD